MNGPGLPSQLGKPDGTLMTFWVIYDRPLDFPDGFVLRPQWVVREREDARIQSSRIAWYADDAEKLRAILPGRASLCFPRHPSEDPCILETWTEL